MLSIFLFSEGWILKDILFICVHATLHPRGFEADEHDLHFFPEVTFTGQQFLSFGKHPSLTSPWCSVISAMEEWRYIRTTSVTPALHNVWEWFLLRVNTVHDSALLLPSAGFERDRAQILEHFWLLLIWQSWEMRLSQKIVRISCFRPVWKYYKTSLSHYISLFPSPQVRKPGDMWRCISWVIVNILFWKDGWLFGFLLFTSYFSITENRIDLLNSFSFTSKY